MSSTKRFGYALVLGSFVVSFSAHAVPIDTDGTWTGVDGTASGETVFLDPDGSDSNNRVEWGQPFTPSPNAGVSAFQFDGVGGLDAPTNGTLFALGDLLHQNLTIFTPGIAGASLDIDVDFSDQGFVTVLNVPVRLNETSNTPGPDGCNPPTPPGEFDCPDVVSVPDVSEVVVINGEEFLLSVLGFSQDGGATAIQEFISNEGGSNVATLFARLDQVNVPVEPTPVAEAPVTTLMGLAMLGLAVTARRRMR